MYFTSSCPSAKEAIAGSQGTKLELKPVEERCCLDCYPCSIAFSYFFSQACLLRAAHIPTTSQILTRPHCAKHPSTSLYDTLTRGVSTAIEVALFPPTASSGLSSGRLQPATECQVPDLLLDHFISAKPVPCARLSEMICQILL